MIVAILFLLYRIMYRLFQLRVMQIKIQIALIIIWKTSLVLSILILNETICK